MIDKQKRLVTAEAVRRGHPDKLCDQIADAILDAHLSYDPNARVAVEVMATAGSITVAGEVTSRADVNYEKTVLDVIQQIGYKWTDLCEDEHDDLDIHIAVHEQSPDIAAAVDGRHPDSDQGAGDQGIMVGYATNETFSMMPRSFVIAQRICRLLDEEAAHTPWLGVDGKAQVSLEYEGDRVAVHTIVVSVQHASNAPEDKLRELVTQVVYQAVGRADIVKSISRLARNTVTMLATVRELKGLGIDVLFEKENIHSMSGDGELMLSILASFAQEESLSVSENCKWRIRKNFAAGESNSFLMYGYRVRGGEYEIIPEEAEIVRKIYEWYLDGTGTGRIAIMLNAMQIPPCRGTTWNRTTIMSILRNEKYTGNLLLQKTFISDHLTKAKKRNQGELPQYYVEGSHEAIIDQETFDRVQDELKRRAEQYETGNSVMKDNNPLAQKITCGLCGKHFIRRFGNTAAKYKTPLWICQTYLTRTKAACPARRISEKVLLPILAGVLGLPDKEDVLEESSRIQEIVVYPEGRLIIQADGETVERHWENPSRALSWTDEMKQEAKRKERERQECLKQQYAKGE